jgi:hypothetical protein
MNKESSVSFDEWLIREAKREGLDLAILFIEPSFGQKCEAVSDKLKRIDELNCQSKDGI